MKNDFDVEIEGAGETVVINEPIASTSASGGLTHRYICPACTGVAFYSRGDGEVPSSICHNCGSEIGQINPENFVPLNESESQSLKDLER